MKMNEIIRKLDAEWEESGFLGRLRSGRFTSNEGDRFLNLLNEIELPVDQLIPKRFVSLIWYLPSFLEWQKDRVAEYDSSRILPYQKFVNQVQNILEQELGVP